MKKIKEMILNDFGLKVFSLLSAMVLWFLVTSFNAPITTMQVMNVTVKLQHTNLITDRNEVFSVEDDSDVIPVVTITAPRSIVDNLKADNVIATADVANMQEDGSIKSFKEKKKEDGGWINAGFMVLEPELLDLIEGDDTVLERYPLAEAARRGQMNGYKHKGFWQCMDTLREKQILEKMWESGNAPWKIWD